MTHVETSRASKFSAFFFDNRISVSVLVLCTMAAPILIPGAGALISIVIALAALIICRKFGSAAMMGIRRPESWPRTILLGAAIGFALQMLFTVLLDPLFEILTGTQLDLGNLDEMKGDPVSYLIWLAIGWGIGGFLEELSFRGYLITRIQSLLGENALGTTTAVIASAIPFGIAHLYQGWAGVLSTGAMGLCFALVYVANRSSLVLPVLVHGFANTVGITLIFLDLTDVFRLF